MASLNLDTIKCTWRTWHRNKGVKSMLFMHCCLCFRPLSFLPRPRGNLFLTFRLVPGSGSRARALVWKSFFATQEKNLRPWPNTVSTSKGSIRSPVLDTGAVWSNRILSVPVLFHHSSLQYMKQKLKADAKLTSGERLLLGYQGVLKNVFSSAQLRVQARLLLLYKQHLLN